MGLSLNNVKAIKNNFLNKKCLKTFLKINNNTNNN